MKKLPAVLFFGGLVLVFNAHASLLGSKLLTEQPFGERLDLQDKVSFDPLFTRENLERNWGTWGPGKEFIRAGSLRRVRPGEFIVDRILPDGRVSQQEVQLRQVAANNSGPHHYLVFWRAIKPEQNELGWEKAWSVAWLGICVNPSDFNLNFFDVDASAFLKAGLKTQSRSFSLLNTHTLLTEDPDKVTAALRSQDPRLFMNPTLFLTLVPEPKPTTDSPSRVPQKN